MIKLKMTSRKRVISHRKSAGRTYSGVVNSRLCDVAMASSSLLGSPGCVGSSVHDGTDGSSSSSYFVPTGLGSEAKKGPFSTCTPFLGNQKPSWNPMPSQSRVSLHLTGQNLETLSGSVPVSRGEQNCRDWLTQCISCMKGMTIAWTSSEAQVYPSGLRAWKRGGKQLVWPLMALI